MAPIAMFDAAFFDLDDMAPLSIDPPVEMAGTNEEQRPLGETSGPTSKRLRV